MSAGGAVNSLRFFFQANVDFQRCQPAVVDRRAETQREAPKFERPVPTPSVVAQLQEVDRRMTFVEHDASHARELAEAAESLAEDVSCAIAGFA
ncbi:hypothetical protein DD237_006661 [Peronospora effusa]|uniref:Uncharacterized protein n=1 Tax=Peronospora effusa TaxID=542832 RepID=A0A3R8CUS6_9STRA|nr:hypothetical protein DD237_006661 [Peronospora effusa]